ncbi:hypothetical protein A5821_002944 [Enterococcus sp. 7F3_DIV0205]|uniref:Nitroreductase domain-containing protein n=1 Tax=Candidatus Enterococcus palustris TaxID=1834189 RepID=A0AAQ3WBX2_9ENTE|nr:nitroreductase family protein [Enterococcus sp. 7F3_DIV0205]OTN83378.1 hypothetical protein A5821_003301 [Enterococcus sp. 7F3_DIV0205]
MNIDSVEQIIRARRTIRTVSDQTISLEVIDELLTSSSYAPYHSKEEPWEVIIVANPCDRQLFVEKIMDSYDRLDTWANYDPQNVTKAKKRTREYFLDVPLTLIVTAPICESEKLNLEAIGAVSAFIQNFQLAAWSRDIGVTWRTIPVIFDEVFKQAVGVETNRQIIGLLDISVVDATMKLPTSRRKPVEQWTTHLSDKLTDIKGSN